ncbi:unnamed protein product [Ixodes pacificus]
MVLQERGALRERSPKTTHREESYYMPWCRSTIFEFQCLNLRRCECSKQFEGSSSNKCSHHK